MTGRKVFGWIAMLMAIEKWTAMYSTDFGLTASDSGPARDSGSTAIVSTDFDSIGPTTDSGWGGSGPRPPL